MNRNQRIFWYGFWANTIRAIGGGVMFVGLVATLFEWYYFFVVFLGIGIIFYGRSLRFDYKRKSGYIIHQGDY
jgi:hypothetical protein